MKTITVREHGEIRVARNGVAGAISVAQADRLTDLEKQYRVEVFRWKHSDRIKATQFVGVAVAGDVVVEVLPKIDSADDAAVRGNLVQMLAKTRKLDIRAGEMAALGKQRNLLEIIVRLFCERLFIEVHRGLVHRYEPQQDNLFVLRGKLDTTRQAKFNAAHPERFFCVYDEFHPDNPFNRILKAAVSLLRKVSRDGDNQRRLNELYFVLEGVNEVHPFKLEWHRVHLDRSNQRFHTLFELAKMFLKNDHQDVSQGRQGGFSLMFDMNRLFEEYIGTITQEVFKDKQVRLQGPQEGMLVSQDGKSAFTGKPDISIVAGEKIECIIDTKWKELDCGVAQADIYQMLAYAHRYNCNKVILLYPHTAKLGKPQGKQECYKIQPSEKEPKRELIVATIELQALEDVGKQLEKILGRNLA
ncbi:MAG: McrC family protein [Gallionellaceae bacterium]|nr:McrC family protein [Gallionellaceae bacterium]